MLQLHWGLHKQAIMLSRALNSILQQSWCACNLQKGFDAWLDRLGEQLACFIARQDFYGFTDTYRDIRNKTENEKAVWTLRKALLKDVIKHRD